MALKGVKKKSYNKFYEENKEKIADKKGPIIKKTLRKVVQSLQTVQLKAVIVTLYMKDPKKSATDSTAQSCRSYKRDLEKNHADSAASRESYIKDPEKSAADSTAQSQESYMKDSEKSAADSTARSQAR